MKKHLSLSPLISFHYQHSKNSLLTNRCILFCIHVKAYNVMKIVIYSRIILKKQMYIFSIASEKCTFPVLWGLVLRFSWDVSFILMPLFIKPFAKMLQK